MSEYFERFLKMKCAGDVLNVLSPINSGVQKEITEGFSILQRVKPLTLREPNKFKVVDLCSGNPVGAVLSAFVLPVSHVFAVDKRKILRDYDRVNKFDYIELDIFSEDIFYYIDEDTILTAIHPCSGLATRIIEIFNKSNAKYLFLMPCCEGNYRIKNKEFLQNNLSRGEKSYGSYLAWVYYLSCQLENSNIIIDKKCLSERDAIIVSRKV